MGNGWNSWRRDDTAQLCSVRKSRDEAIEHAVSGFAHGEDANVREATKVVGAIGAAKVVGGDGEATLDGGARVDRIQGATEDFAGEMFAVHRFGSIGREGCKVRLEATLSTNLDHFPLDEKGSWVAMTTSPLPLFFQK